MESFNIKSDLVEMNVKMSFGNMYFFGKGNYIFNKKGIGLYFTVITIILTNAMNLINL